MVEGTAMSIDKELGEDIKVCPCKTISNFNPFPFIVLLVELY